MKKKFTISYFVVHHVSTAVLYLVNALTQCEPGDIAKMLESRSPASYLWKVGNSVILPNFCDISPFL